MKCFRWFIERQLIVLLQLVLVIPNYFTLPHHDMLYITLGPSSHWSVCTSTLSCMYTVGDKILPCIYPNAYVYSAHSKYENIAFWYIVLLFTWSLDSILLLYWFLCMYVHTYVYLYVRESFQLDMYYHVRTNYIYVVIGIKIVITI